MRERFLPKYRPVVADHIALNEVDDRAFEQIVYKQLSEAVAKDADSNPRGRVALTPRSADRGRDVVVGNLEATRLLGFSLYDPGSKTVLVECKRVGGRRLNIDHVASNILQIENSGQTCFLLVTNATLTPRSIALLQTHCHRVKARFLLADAYNLLDHFPKIGSVAPNSVATVSKQERMHVSYQALPELAPDRGYTVHIIIRSFYSRPVTIRLAFHSTYDWSSSSAEPEVATISAHDVLSYTFRLRPRRALLKESARFVLTIGGQRELFDLKLSGGQGELLELPLLNTKMAHELDKYCKQLQQNSEPRFLHLHAPSGTGKTRFMTEVMRLARNLGRTTTSFRITGNGNVVVVAQPGDNGKLSRRIISQNSLTKLVEDGLGRAADLIIIDDAHEATKGTLQALLTLAFSSQSLPTVIVAGRSDASFRQVEYEAMARLLAENIYEGRVEQLAFGDLTDEEIDMAIHKLLPGEAVSSFGLRSRPTHIRAVDLVHVIHSLLERHYLSWTDEDTLSVNNDHRELLEQFDQYDQSTSGILDYRYEHLSEVRFTEFTLAELFELLALVNDEGLTFSVLEKLRSAYPSPIDSLTFWIEESKDVRNARFAHDTIREYLVSKAYSFGGQRHFGAITSFFSELRDRLSPLHFAVIALHERDLKKAFPLIAPFARRLRSVTNISSLQIDQHTYNDLASLIFSLLNSSHVRPILFYRTLIARAYLNTHARHFAQGFLDNMRLLAMLEGLPPHPKNSLIIAGVRQLMAHALQNSGDLQTSLILMHGVENLLKELGNERRAKVIEFDMCDRLQSYYSRLSALSVAQGFFRRGRVSAHLSGEQALVNISLSAEFHLYRYLDCDEAFRMAVRQHRHAISHAPLRSKLHAELNEAVARWTLHGAVAPDSSREVLERVGATSRENGFGHLIPRVEYLLAVDAYHAGHAGRGPASLVLNAIRKAHTSALQYGYGEYTWLSQALRLLLMIDSGSDPASIVRLAVELIDDLRVNALTFVADDYLCYQNVVVLSNALHAIYEFADDTAAWRHAKKISFSPLMLLSQAERDARLRDVFLGSLLCKNYDTRSLIKTDCGYLTVLV